MDDLLARADAEKADKLELHLGKPPAMVWYDKYPKLWSGKVGPIEGPAITIEDSEHFLFSLANSRQRREIRERGCSTFFFLFRGSILFLVRASVTDGVVGFEIQ